MRVFYCDHYPVPLPQRHRFPMQKYAQLRRALVERGVLAADALHPAPPATIDEVRLVHSADYVAQFCDGTLERQAISRLGFPWSAELVARSFASVGGTLAAARAAVTDGISGTLSGGTHHAHADFGAGYCAFNDIAVAARCLQAEGAVERVLVVDLDVHQGDGTAAIFADDPTVVTLSLHGERNFPARKARSDFDSGLADGTGDDEYLSRLAAILPQALQAARADVLFYQAGVDPLAGDRLGRLALSHAGLERRDRLVLKAARRHALPVVLTLGGGYAEPIQETLEAHLNTYRAARDMWSPVEPAPPS